MVGIIAHTPQTARWTPARTTATSSGASPVTFREAGLMTIPVLEAPYTPRYDFQGVSNDNDLQAIVARLRQFTTTT